jgi:hypothetical protein
MSPVLQALLLVDQHLIVLTLHLVPNEHQGQLG